MRAIIRCNINVLNKNGNIKPVPKLANQFARSKMPHIVNNIFPLLVSVRSEFSLALFYKK